MDFENYLKATGTALKLSRGDHVFRQGGKGDALYWVKQGILKAYYVSEDGREQVESFLSTSNIIGSLTAVYAGGQNSFSLVCLEDTQLVRFSFSDMRSLAADNRLIADRMTDLLLSLAMKKERREYEFLCLSAEERYRLFLERQPKLVSKITQQDIALYLGITPVALSRIKKRMQVE
ncbi:MAG: Crp/Fnr family transcriptional regulator [Kordiimonadaceae bacterium]|nr:Crp/Fnr family transcriptional regulator [Kordiimonadaceae bacterium]